LETIKGLSKLVRILRSLRAEQSGSKRPKEETVVEKEKKGRFIRQNIEQSQAAKKVNAGKTKIRRTGTRSSRLGGGVCDRAGFSPFHEHGCLKMGGEQ